MRVPVRSGRRGEGGRCLGCILLPVLGALALVLGTVGYLRLTATPALGPLPGGTLDGQDQRAIAAAMALQLAPQLAGGPHAVASLTERDLTVLVAENNPDPATFRDVHARIRDGLLVVDARTDLGPFTVTAVGRLRPSLTDLGGEPDVRLDVVSIDAGDVSLPSAVRNAIQDRIERSASLHGIFSASPSLARLRPYLDCVGIDGSMVQLGFHRPGTAADPGACGAPSPSGASASAAATVA